MTLDPPTVDFLVYVFSEMPTPDNAEHVCIHAINLNIAGSYEEFGVYARAALQAKYPSYDGFALYRVRFFFCCLKR